MSAIPKTPFFTPDTPDVDLSFVYQCIKCLELTFLCLVVWLFSPDTVVKEVNARVPSWIPITVPDGGLGRGVGGIVMV